MHTLPSTPTFRRGAWTLGAAGLLAAALIASSGGSPSRTTTSADPGDAALAAQFRHFALHALLLPLVDFEDERPRWRDPSLVLPCGPGTQVWADGRAPRAGEPVPPSPFVVRWHLDGCAPFGMDGLLVDGDAVLRIEPGGRGPWKGTVQASRLRLEAGARHAALEGRFDAVLP